MIQRLIGELIGQIGLHLSSVCRPHSLNIFSSETTWAIEANFHMEPIWTNLNGMGERKFVQVVLVTWPRWLPCTHFQTSSPQKPLGRLKPNFMWSLLGTTERKFVQTVLVTWPRWPPCPFMVKTLKNLLLRRVMALDIQFVQKMTLGWPWPI